MGTFLSLWALSTMVARNLTMTMQVEGDLNLLQLALDQKRIQFLNNERADGLMIYVCRASTFLNPCAIEKRSANWTQVLTLQKCRASSEYRALVLEDQCNVRPVYEWEVPYRLDPVFGIKAAQLVVDVLYNEAVTENTAMC